MLSLLAVLSVSACDVFLRRREFRAAAGAPSRRGAVWAGVFLAMAWLGLREGAAAVWQTALAGLAWSVPYALLGRGVGRLTLFPAWFLLFAGPVPHCLDALRAPLRLLVAGTAAGILNGLGLEAGRAGTVIFSGVPGDGFALDVADPCSGVRSLFAMTALAAGYAHFTLERRRQRWLLLTCAVPIAVGGNILRVLSICLVAAGWGQEVAAGAWHDYSGYLTFGLGALLILSAQERLARGLCTRHNFRLWIHASPRGGEPPRRKAAAICAPTGETRRTP